MNLLLEFESALSLDNYISLLDDKKDLHDLHYRKAQVESNLPDFLKLNILIITEPWCGDSTAIIPVLIKQFENYNAELRVLLRDKNPEVMDKFLTRGARSIPIIIVMDNDYEVLMKFGPRPENAQNIYEEHRKMIESGKIEKKEVIKKIRTFYARDRGKSIANEFVFKLEKALSSVYND